MKKINENECLVANSKAELVEALQQHPAKILITQPYRDEFLEHTEIPLPEENLFSGSHTAAGLAGNPIFLAMNALSKNDKEQKIIDRKVQKYRLKAYGEDVLLYLRQLEY